MICPVCKRTPLKGRQRVACSGKCRAVLARRKQEAAARAPLERALVTLAARAEALVAHERAALEGRRAILAELEGALQEARTTLLGDREG